MINNTNYQKAYDIAGKEVIIFTSNSGEKKIIREKNLSNMRNVWNPQLKKVVKAF